MRYEATYTANAVSVRVVTYGMRWADIFSICMVEESNARVNLGGLYFPSPNPTRLFPRFIARPLLFSTLQIKYTGGAVYGRAITASPDTV